MKGRGSPSEPLTVERLRAAYAQRGPLIRSRLREFEALRHAPDALLLEEMAYCIFAAGSSAEMGLRSVERVRPLLLEAPAEEMAAALKGLRFPNTRSAYLADTRDFLRAHCGLRIRELLESFADPLERRRFLAETPQIRGFGYKEASHFLRNVGYRGYAILDKHILGCLHELGVVDFPSPPRNAREYLAGEAALKALASEVAIDPDELDLLLWSERTGRVAK